MAKKLVYVFLLILMLFQTPFKNGVASAQGTVEFVEKALINHFPDELIFRVDISSNAAELVSAKFIYSFDSHYSSTSYTKEAIEMKQGSSLSLEYIFDTRDMTTPPMMPIAYYWEVVDENGQKYESESKTVRYEDTRYEWDELSNDDVHVLWHDRPNSFGKAVFDIANKSVKSQRALFQTDLDYPIYIVIQNDAKEFATWHSLAHDWVGGESYGNYGITAQIVEDSTFQQSWLNDVVPHEISHLYFAQLTHNPTVVVPTWLNEGVAQYNEFTNSNWILNDVRDAAKSGEIIPLSSLERGFGAFNQERVYLSYAEALSAATFFMERYGSEGMSALLAAYKDGDATDAAFQNAIGVSFAGFQDEWFAWIGVPESFATNTPRAFPTFLPSPTMMSFGSSSENAETDDATETPVPPTQKPTSTPVPVEATSTPTPKTPLPCSSVGVVFLAVFSSGFIFRRSRKRSTHE